MCTTAVPRKVIAPYMRWGAYILSYSYNDQSKYEIVNVIVIMMKISDVLNQITVIT
jgi:hypothetical protein